MKNEVKNEDSKIKTARSNTCPTLSKKSELKYSVGVDAAKATYLRVNSNDGGGFFSGEWLAWKDIQLAIEEAEPVTSICLRPLFKGKSVNTSGFLLAVLVAEGLLESLPKKVRLFKPTGKSLTATKATPRKTPAKKAPSKARKS